MVSVVITTYKRRVSQIKAAIDSVLNQSHENLELIIVDDSPNEYEYRDEVKITAKIYRIPGLNIFSMKKYGCLCSSKYRIL